MTYASQWRPASIFLGIVLHCLFAHAQSGDGGTADGFQNSNLGATGSGAEGSSNSSANLSKGAIIAIAVVVAAVVVGGITLAILFYLAKKRQWQVRKTIRRTATSVVRAMTPRTPAKMTFGLRSPRVDQQSHGFMDKNRSLNNKSNKRDIEKGFTTVEINAERTSQDTSNTQSHSPQRLLKEGMKKDLTLKVPSSNRPTPTPFPESECPKSPMWQKVLGRK